MVRVAIAMFLFVSVVTACGSAAPPPGSATPASGARTSPAAMEVLSAARPPFMGSAEPAVEDASGCNMDTLNGAPWSDEGARSADRASVDIRGWGADVTAKVAPTSTYVELVDQAAHAYFVPTTRQSRPGVAQKFAAPALEMSGYEARFAAAELPAGDYAVSIVMDIGGHAVACSSKRKLHFD
jgi:hypothetical protein